MLNLIIVESPSKAKTMKKFLKDGYEIMSSQGHICNLPQKELGIDIENDFKPKYLVDANKKRMVEELRNISKKSDVIYLASDDDREGEAISWHLKNILELDEKKTKRIVFHEITEKAIKKALEKPRTINEDLVNSQQARRILDRLVGYKVSPILWKKIKLGLSAGRVQSVAVRLIVDKEREILDFKTKQDYRVIATFKYKKSTFKSELKNKISTKEDVLKLYKDILECDFIVKNVEKKEVTKSPVAPFTTSTLQQEASTKLGYDVSKTMLLAQHLYEAGKISYMRTDSVILSEDAIKQAKDVILREYGKEYVQNRQYKNDSKLAQEAHEAIRPTHFADVEVSEDIYEQKLYNLIRNRALASQMADAKLSKTTITIVNNSDKKVYTFILKGETIEFDGFLKLYLVRDEKEDDDDENIKDDSLLPDLKVNDIVNLEKIISKERYSRGPARYSEATLVKELEERGIGRPSTYAPTISVIQTRGYVVKESREGVKRELEVIKMDNKGNIEESKEVKTEGSEKNKLYPTEIAMITNDFLIKSFPEFLNYDFTANVEKKLDNIADGKENYISFLHNFYDGLLEQLNKCDSVEKVEVQTARLLGIDPESNRKIYVRKAKFGPVIQVGDKEDSEKPKFISLPKNQNLSTITLEQALKFMNLPKIIGKYKDNDIIVNIGQYGPYIKCGNINATIFDKSRVFDITEQEAIEIINKKEQMLLNKNKN